MNNKYKILLVEDEDNIRSLVTTMLESANYQVIIAETCSNAVAMFTSHVPDLVILDLGLPDRDGMSFLKTIRENSATPVIILSARLDEKDKVAALDMGANDYITKPFGSAELLARIRTALRSSRYNADEEKLLSGKLRLEELLIDYDARRVFMRDEEIKLTQTEYNIVRLLSEHLGKMMTYSAIIKAVWGYSDDGSIKKLQVNMANIRKKFGARPGQASYIKNELGVGYRMDAEKD